MNVTDLIRQETHFAFGQNWAAYAEKITDAEIEEAERGLRRLLGCERLDGTRFLDVGSGSGLHSLAALRLGAWEVMAVDIDPDSVATTRALLTRHAAHGNFRVAQGSVFDLDPHSLGTFDTVYSWGVLHHTGDMERAVRCAAALVGEAGDFAFALYRRTWMDWFWKREKRWYAHAARGTQARARKVYIALSRFRLSVKGVSFADHVAGYRRNRGMDYYHDVHDWMGGWPYEPIAPDEVERMMAGMGLAPVRVFARKGRLFGRDLGLFGSGCDQYVYRRVRADAKS